MAAGFKTATVNASDVPATQTNFPSYVDLSRLGITTLAEAQSVRVYSDSAKTTELAREIVSATEMHVKIPSLTSTTSIYVDYDGVRADYAVTDTYGRNAVWSSTYDLVHHFESVTANSVNGNSPTSNTFSYDSTSKFGTGITQTDGSTRGMDWGSSVPMNTSTMSISCWFNTNAAITQENSGMMIFSYQKAGSPYNSFILSMLMGSVSADRGKVRCSLRNSSGTTYSAVSTVKYNDGQWHHMVGTYNGSNIYLYVDRVQVATVSATGTVGSSSYKTTIGTNWDEAASDVWVGDYDEVRSTDGFALSADWTTTEYNNQSDEAGFWGTWSDVGGGGGANTTNFFRMA